MLLRKAPAHHHAQGREAGKEDAERQPVMPRDLACLDQNAAYHEIEERPHHVDCWRGEPSAGRLCEGRGKRVTAHAVHKMRHGIREKCTGKETANIAEPHHICLYWRSLARTQSTVK